MRTPRSSAKRPAQGIAEEITPRRSAHTNPGPSSPPGSSKRDRVRTPAKRPKAKIKPKGSGEATGVLTTKVQASTGVKGAGTRTEEEEEEEEEPTGNIVAVASPVRRPTKSRYGEPYILIPITTPTRRPRSPVSQSDGSPPLDSTPLCSGRIRARRAGDASQAVQPLPLPPAGVIMRTKPPHLSVPGIPPAAGSSRQLRTRPSLPANLPAPSSTSGRRKRKAPLLPRGSAESRSAVERALSGGSRSLRPSARSKEA